MRDSEGGLQIATVQTAGPLTVRLRLTGATETATALNGSSYTASSDVYVMRRADTGTLVVMGSA